MNEQDHVDSCWQQAQDEERREYDELLAQDGGYEEWLNMMNGNQHTK